MPEVSLSLPEETPALPLPEAIIAELGGDMAYIDTEEGERLYSVRDWVYWVSGSKSKRRIFAWNDTKSKMQTVNDLMLEKIYKARYLTKGGKQLFDFAPEKVLLYIKTNYLDYCVRNRKHRFAQEADEVFDMHPEVMAMLKEHGWEVEHHVRLPSGRIIDIVATQDDRTLAIECKPLLTGDRFYEAVGQAMCYAIEYHPYAYPAIATYNVQVSEYVKRMCLLSEIVLITLPEWDGF
jgi:hypothetical protein